MPCGMQEGELATTRLPLTLRKTAKRKLGRISPQAGGLKPPGGLTYRLVIEIRDSTRNR